MSVTVIAEFDMCSPIAGQASLPESCLVCAHSPLTPDDCKPNKALRLTVKAFLKNEEKKRDKDKEVAQIVAPPEHEPDFEPVTVPAVARKASAQPAEVATPGVVPQPQLDDELPESEDTSAAEALVRTEPSTSATPIVGDEEAAATVRQGLSIESDQAAPENDHEEDVAKTTEGPSDEQESLSAEAKSTEPTALNGFGMNGGLNGMANGMGMSGMMDPMMMSQGMFGGFNGQGMGMGMNGMPMGMGMGFNDGSFGGGWNGNVASMNGDFGANAGLYPGNGYNQQTQRGGHFNAMHNQMNNFQHGRFRQDGFRGHRGGGRGRGFHSGGSSRGGFEQSAYQNSGHGSFRQATTSVDAQSGAGQQDTAADAQVEQQQRDADEDTAKTEDQRELNQEKSRVVNGSADGELTLKSGSVDRTDDMADVQPTVEADDEAFTKGIAPLDDVEEQDEEVVLQTEPLLLNQDEAAHVAMSADSSSFQARQQLGFVAPSGPAANAYGFGGSDYGRGRGFGRRGFVRGGFEPRGRGGRGGYDAYGGYAADVPSASAAEPQGLGVVGAPTGPKAMREGVVNGGRGRGGFQAFGRGALQNGASPAGPGVARSVYVIFEETTSANETDSHSASHDQRESASVARQRSNSRESSRPPRQRDDQDDFGRDESRRELPQAGSPRHDEHRTEEREERRSRSRDLSPAPSRGHRSHADSDRHRSQRHGSRERSKDRDSRKRRHRSHSRDRRDGDGTSRSRRDRDSDGSRHDRNRDRDRHDRDRERSRRESNATRAGIEIAMGMTQDDRINGGGKRSRSSRDEVKSAPDPAPREFKIQGRSKRSELDVQKDIVRKEQPSLDPYALEREARNRERMLKEQEHRLSVNGNGGERKRSFANVDANSRAGDGDSRSSRKRKKHGDRRHGYADEEDAEERALRNEREREAARWS
ncbi:hypothetical protein MRB53_037017 [Persea americana]|nr:hypothetical protein MRB53_037017 [Persea americana]